MLDVPLDILPCDYCVHVIAEIAPLEAVLNGQHFVCYQDKFIL